MTKWADPRAAARDAAHAFAVAGSLAGIDRLGRGHIHDTFAVSFEAEGAVTRYVLQRLNDRVFPTPLDVMRNVVQVTEHLQRKLADAGVSDPARRCLRLIPTRDGNTHIQDTAGALWRMYPFIEGATALESVESETQAYEAARAFGEFVGQLADLPPARLAETIPGFHDLEARVANLEQAAVRNAAARNLEDLAPELEGFQAGHAHVAAALAAEPPLPRRVVHNDCKLDNVLLDRESGAALCVIDLDTVMEGTLIADFGDLVRTAANPAAEDEPDLARVDFDLRGFGALARGYLAGLGEALHPEELSALPLAGPTLALENGVRFLADHLDGDIYFPAHRPGHNLDRARGQLRLLELMLARLEEARTIVAEAAQSGRSSVTAG